MATLQRKKISANGKNVLYSIPGLPGAVRFSRAMFDGEPPATLEVSANFVAAKPVKVVDPAKAAEREAAKAKRLETAQARAAKAIERAEKAKARFEKLQAKAQATPPAETAPAV